MTGPVTGVSPAPLPYKGDDGGVIVLLGVVVVVPVVVPPVVETIPPAELQISEKTSDQACSNRENYIRSVYITWLLHLMFMKVEKHNTYTNRNWLF